MIFEGRLGDDYCSVNDFFSYLERKTYKMHVRVFLSRYRSYVTCPLCKGARLRAEALSITVKEKTRYYFPIRLHCWLGKKNHRAEKSKIKGYIPLLFSKAKT